MVKPPKTMQPEAVNLKKAGRDSSKAFGEDSFVHYMARKIDMQRKQFGLVLPPPPPSPKSAISIENNKTTTNDQMKGDAGYFPRPENAVNDHVPKQKRKRFGITGIVKRLKKKHGEQSIHPILRLEDQADELAADAPPLLPSQRILHESQAIKDVTSAEGKFSSTKPYDNAVQHQEEDRCERSFHGATRRSDLFMLGVVVLINGYTNPDAETLQRMLQRHGGDVEKYETSRVTHIIAEQLSSAKASIYKKQKRPRPVCKPAWITDSVENGRKLPCSAYLLDQVRKESVGATKSVSNFYLKKGNTPDKKTSIENNVDSLTRSLQETKSPVNTLDLPQQRKGRFINGKVRTVGTDPNFLESFFQSSRLSFIGSYKQRAAQSPTKPVSLRCQAGSSTRYVFHVDMDCFFASVALRKFPEYRDKPVAISHHGLKESEEPTNRNVPKNSSSECATCNYVARQFGIKKGMFLGRAKELCPSLIVLHYDFEGYEEVSEAVHEILVRRTFSFNGFIEQVSCDESYVEIFVPQTTDSPSLVVGELAEKIRNEIFEETQCTATVGVASNKLLSKLATDFAKPNGSYVVQNHKILLGRLDLSQLPGIGYHLRRKLVSNQFVTVKDVWNRGSTAQHDLCDIIGNVNGNKLYEYCQGIDNRSLTPSTRKTIGAEVCTIVIYLFLLTAAIVQLWCTLRWTVRARPYDTWPL